MTAPQAHDIFLTGGTGLLGSYILKALLQRPNVRCRLLVRPPLSTSQNRLASLLAVFDMSLDKLIADGRVRLVEGELPGRIDPSELAGANQVIHAAARTTFEADHRGEPRMTNLDGTQSLLQAARRADVKHFLFVSTAYVCGDRRGCVSETVASEEPVFCNDYEYSKWHAEQLVRSWADAGRIATICRPSILIGDRAIGRTTRMGGLYVLIRATDVLARAVADDDSIDRHRVPLKLVGRANATVNVVPVCWAADRIASVALDPALHGLVHHVTNPHAPAHVDIKTWLEEYFDIAGAAYTESSWPWENPTSYEEAFYSISNPMQDYFKHNLHFESRLNDIEENGKPLVDRDHFFHCIRYAQETGWGRGRTKPGASTAQPERFDPRWYFEEFVPERLPHSKVARIAALTTVVRFIVEGERDQEWTYRFEGGRLMEFRRGPNALAEEFGYRIARADLQDIAAGNKTLQSEFFNGRAEMFGNVLQAMKMAPIIQSFLGEFPIPSGSSENDR